VSKTQNFKLFKGLPHTVKSLRKRKRKSCNPPVWNAATGNNWPLAGVMNNTEPTYELLVKGLDKQGRYKPGRKHKSMVFHSRGCAYLSQGTG